VKLLFDQNLSPRLVQSLASLYPDSTHVREVGLQEADDQKVWEFARNDGFTVVSKDSDFRQRSFLLGFPPKVIWLRLGNCTTSDIEHVLKQRETAIRKFCDDPVDSFLMLS
jgi:predicted nuclease of predicted toxin-antitoxin system